MIIQNVDLDNVFKAQSAVIANIDCDNFIEKMSFEGVYLVRISPQKETKKLKREYVNMSNKISIPKSVSVVDILEENSEQGYVNCAEETRD